MRRRNPVTKTQINKSLAQTLTAKEVDLSTASLLEVRISKAHKLLLASLGILSSTTQRQVLEMAIEALARQNSLPQPPIPCVFSRGQKTRTTIPLQEAERIHDSWPELWEMIAQIVDIKKRAVAASKMPPEPMKEPKTPRKMPEEQVERLRAKGVVEIDLQPLDPNWEPESVDVDDDEDRLIADIAGLD